ADAADLVSAFARGGVAVAILLIAAVGGRLVPSLTRNALAAAGRDGGGVPEPYGRFNVAVLVVALPALAAWTIAPAHVVTATACGLAAVLQAVRLARWRGWRVRRFDVLALHVGYLWVVAGTALAALAADPLAVVPADAALHAFTAGAIGTMTMAVMARLAGTRGARGRTHPRLAAFAVALATV
ncbi:NnrS family protein, partial [Oharaeibacter diazotrophicus]